MDQLTEDSRTHDSQLEKNMKFSNEHLKPLTQAGLFVHSLDADTGLKNLVLLPPQQKVPDVNTADGPY